MADPKAVGIDLGTTNSAVAWLDESGRTAILRNSEGDLLTPSVVFFDDTEIVVGKEAVRAATTHPDRVAQWVKRDMGSPVYSRPIRGEYLPPEVIQSCILRKLRADIVGTLGAAAKAVITVPAYFDEPRRKATADAGEMAGLSLLDIVNEPTSAALAFGEVLGYLSPAGKPLAEMTVMVYDLGGGTFDATLLRLAPGDIRTLATDGDVQLGGHDWDARLVAYAAEAFKSVHGSDPRVDPAALNRLYNEVVEAKHALSARTRTLIRVEFAGRSHEITVHREQFEEMTADLLERTAYTSRQLLAAAKLQWTDVSRILLVGGSTRMPMVSRKLQEITGILPDRTVNPDEAVARGAAIYANYLLSSPQQGGSGAAFQVTNVNSHSLGIEGIDPQTMRKINVVLIPRNTALPARFAEKFITKTEGQRSIVIQVLEGESSLPGDCTAIGRTVIHDLPANLPQNWPIEVTFEYGANGRLTVRGVVPGTNRETTLELERDVGLSHEGISRWKRVMGGTAGFDQFESMLQEVLNLPAVDKGPVTSPPAAVGPINGGQRHAGPPSGLGTELGPADPAVQPAAKSTPPNPAVPASPVPFTAVPDVLGHSPGSYELTAAYIPPPAASPAPAFGRPGAIHSQPTPLFDQPGGMQSQPTPSLGRPMSPDSPMPGADPAGAGPAPWMASLPPQEVSPRQDGPPIPQRLAAGTGAAKPRISRRVFSIAGVATSAVAGLGLGYLLYKRFLRSMNAPQTSEAGKKNLKAEPAAKDAESAHPLPHDRPEP